MSPLEALVALNLLPGLGPVRIRRLLDAFGSASRILQADLQQLLQVSGIGRGLADLIHHWQDHADPAAEIAAAAQRGIAIIGQQDEHYPDTLRQTYDAPLLLYCWGELKPEDRRSIGIVGSRRSSFYGIQITRKLSYQLAHHGFTIISGLARGIDTAAHEAAIAAGGRTVAVIGSGLACIYPPENFALAEKIASGHGAVVSEFPLQTRPDKRTFPVRNRIVAGWSQALLVSECPAWSGALITANLATEYGRPVLAVPGPVDKPGSAGCNRLIREGATLVCDAADVLSDLGQSPPLAAPPGVETAAPADLPQDEAAILAALDSSGSCIDELVERCGLPASTIARSLARLEIRGLIQACPGSRFAGRDPRIEGLHLRDHVATQSPKAD